MSEGAARESGAYMSANKTIIPCPICRGDAEMADDPRGDAARFKCQRCGHFGATGTAYSMLAHHTWAPRQIANASGWVREHQGIQFSRDHIEFVASLATPSVGERAMKILLEFARRAPEIGQTFDFRFDAEMVDWIAVSWSIDIGAVEYLFVHYLNATGLIEGQYVESIGPGFLHTCQITPQGHTQLEEMRLGGRESQIGFCAMWFSPKLLPVWTHGIEPAIRASGYDPQRIDRIEHNNKIDDQIVATIRRSRFVVADFTGNRGGVYFEAGFAMGLDIPVIWTIRGGRFHRVHFDNRQYNFVDWTFERLADFKVRLQNRIEATLGRGPKA